MRSIRLKLSDPQTRSKQLTHLLPAVALIFVAVLSGCAGTGVRNSARTFNTVIIDAGHGGHDQGTRSSKYMPEKAAALDVVQRLEPKLRAAGFRTVMTRKGDYFVTLDNRVAISNRENNAVFVSVHFNEARRRRDISGVEVYYPSGQSSELAQTVLRHTGAIPGSHPRFIKQARFRVLRMNRNPAVLIEGGYFTNKSEAARFADPKGREALAQAITDALVEQKRK